MLAGIKGRRPVLSFIKRVLSSPCGLLLASVHLSLVVCYFVQLEVTGCPFGLEGVITGSTIGDRYMDFESTLLIVLVGLNLLPLLLSQGILKIVIILLPQLSVSTFSWVMAYLLIGLSSVQWLLVGYFIERMMEIYRSSD